jgi:ABC-type transport system substrate-binding protein
MRWIRRKTERATIRAAAALSTLLSACSSPLPDPTPDPHPADPTPRRGGTLHLASFADMRALDPAVAGDVLSESAVEVLFAGLIDYDQKANVVPDLASRYEVESDGTVYRFFLREGALFHDGTEVTADDVKRSIERALHPSTPNPSGSFYESIFGYEAYSRGKAEHLQGVVVEGRYVVAIHLKERDARFLFAFALCSLRPVCKSAGDRYSDSWTPCGAGPFKILRGGWDRGRSLTIVRHEGYFRPGKPYLDAVTWALNVNRSSEIYRFEDGDLDSTQDLSDGEVNRFLSDPRWKPYSAFEPDRNVIGEFMNTELPPFDNVEVRRAVAAGIDREHYRLLKPASIAVATQAIPPTIPGYDPSFKGQTYDYAAALEHMKRAGYPYDPETGAGGYGPTIPYHVYPSGGVLYTAQVLQQELAKIGLRIEIRLINYPSFLALTSRRKASPMSAPGWQMDYPDPSDFFDPVFGSDAINDESSTNFAFYRNPRLDELLTRAHHELDAKARYALYGEANRIVCDDAPEAFTHFFHFLVVSQPFVHGFGGHTVWSSDTADTWIDRPDTRAERSKQGMNWLWLGGLANAAGHPSPVGRPSSRLGP